MPPLRDGYPHPIRRIFFEFSPTRRALTPSFSRPFVPVIRRRRSGVWSLLLMVAVVAWASDLSPASAQVEPASQQQDFALNRLLPDTAVAVALTEAVSGMELRVGRSATWDDWILVEQPVDEVPDPDGVAAEPTTTVSFGPIWLGENADRLEIRMPPGLTPPRVHVITSDDIDTGGASDRSDARLSGGVSAPGGSFASGSIRLAPALPGVELLQAPAIRPRQEWGAKRWGAEEETCGSAPSVASSLKAAVVHHTVTGNNYSADQADDVIRAIQFTHTAINGWCDIGYNFIVDRFGTIWEARTGSLAGPVIGGHTRGFNSTTVGIALLGHHHPARTSAGTGVQPSAAALAAVRQVASWKLASHGVDPGGRTWLRNRADTSPLRLAGNEWHYVPTIVGHRDLGVTSCPGDLAYGHVHSLGSEIQASQPEAARYQRPSWTARGHGPAVAVVDAASGVLSAGAATGPASRASSAQGGDVAAIAGGAGGGYVLYRDGAIEAIGGAAAMVLPAEWPPRGTVAVDLALAGGGGAWVLTDDGVVRPVGGAPAVARQRGEGDVVALSLDRIGRGYIATRSGGLFPVGGADAVTVGGQLSGTVIDIAVSERRYPETANADGDRPVATASPSVWVLTDDGSISAVGSRGVVVRHHFLEFLTPERREGLGIGSVNLEALQPRRVIASSEENGGWVMDQHGQLWPFGDARLITPVSTRAAQADATDVALLELVADSEFLQSGDARFVDALYQLFVGRAVGAAEASRAVYDLEIGVDRSELITPLVLSPGWAGSRVDRAFAQVLGRSPATSGRRYWLDQLSSGMTFEQLGVNFYGSPEYYRSSGGNAGFVGRLYQALLGRDPAPTGLEYWTNQLDTGQLRPAGLARLFYRSPESRRDRTVQLYEEILSRRPTRSELTAGAELLESVDDRELAADLASSAEFYRLAADS